MAYNPGQYIRNYFKKKSWFSIITDILFVVLVALLVNPGTRTEVSSFFIKMTSFAPSALDADEQFEISTNAKNWKVYDIQGNEHLFSELNKKPVFLNLWATWCPPCIAELPSIQDLHQSYGDKVSFILLSNENPAVVKAFAEKKGYNNMDFYFSNTTPSDFATQSIPTTFVISSKGKVVINKKGAARWSSGKMENLLNGLIQN
jgi:thiol-disulfide isomerase/thioredoxin